MITTQHVTSIAVLLALIVAPGCDGADFQMRTETADREDTAALCEDGADNDGDGNVDCEDPDCSAHCEAGEEEEEEDEFVLPEKDPWHNRDREIVEPSNYVSESSKEGSFPLVAEGAATRLVVSDEDFEGVVRAARDLRADIERVTEVAPELSEDGAMGSGDAAVLIGTLGQSPLIDELVDKEVLDVGSLEGKWETFVITSVEQPREDLDRARNRSGVGLRRGSRACDSVVHDEDDGVGGADRADGGGGDSGAEASGTGRCRTRICRRECSSADSGAVAPAGCASARQATRRVRAVSAGRAVLGGADPEAWRNDGGALGGDRGNASRAAPGGGAFEGGRAGADRRRALSDAVLPAFGGRFELKAQTAGAAPNSDGGASVRAAVQQAVKKASTLRCCLRAVWATVIRFSAKMLPRSL